MPDPTPPDLQPLLQAQRDAFAAELPVTLDTRKDRLGRLSRMLADEGERFCTAMSEDFGHRSREQSMMTDIVPSITTAKETAKTLSGWMKPDKRSPIFPLGLLGGSARVEYQPKGVVGIIVPWNFPVALTAGPLIGALAAGNRACVKMSEYTPATSELMAEAVARYFDPAEVTVVTGGPEVGAAFSRLDWDHLLFTGATAIGRHILHAAADTLTPVTLELGGKSPVIVGRSADVARTTERVALGKLLNAGQICLAPDYMLVPEEMEDAIAAGLKRAAGELYPSILRNPDMTAIVNDRHHERLYELVEDARAKGARVEIVNPAREDFAASNSRKMPLHLVRDPTPDMRVMQEEIFGPVLPIATYRTPGEAIARVNRGDRPLGLYYFGSDKAEEQMVLSRTISGGVTVNDVIFHNAMEDLPFGGIGPSGMGSYHGRDGFRTFSHAKAVYRQPKLDVAKIAGFKPPYGAATTKTIAKAFGG